MKKTQTGFTLIELVVVIVILGIIAATSSSLLLTSFKGMIQTYTQNQLMQKGEYALTKMSADISNVKDNSTTNILIAAAQDFQFVDTSGTTIEYALSGTTLQQSLSSGSSNIAFLNNVTGLTFTYLNAAGAELTSPVSALSIPAIKYINISITQTISGTAMTFTQTVFLRNANN